jgi:glycosyltransferase involved in cell wall biosynthesis
MSLQYLLEGQLAYMQHQGFDVLAVSADGPEVRYLTEQGIAHHIVPMTRTITPWRDLLCLWQLVRLFRKWRPDIVHTHTPKAGLLGMLAARLAGVPIRLHTVAGLPLMEARGWQRSLLWCTEWLTYYCAQAVYPNSRGLLLYLHQHFLGLKSRFAFIGQGSSNGIDAAHFSPTSKLREHADHLRAQARISTNALVFCFVGRLVGDKGIHELVEAFISMAPALPEVHLLLVGPFEDERDPVRAEIRIQVDQHPRIHAVGFQADVRPWLLAADVFVFPSYREGFPNVVMQAACLGLPCIVSDINGCNEIIHHEHTGLVVPPKNSEALRTAMERLGSDANLRLTFAQRAWAFVATRFERQALWRLWREEYLERLGETR